VCWLGLEWRPLLRAPTPTQDINTLGEVIVADLYNNRIRRVSSSGIESVVCWIYKSKFLSFARQVL
jgi:hypothetical protein